MVKESLRKRKRMKRKSPVYKEILEKRIPKKEDIARNFEIPCNVGALKYQNALVDQGSDVNVMPLATYERLTKERPTETDIRLSLASHSYIYPLGIAEDVLVEIAGFVFLVDFVILDIKEDEKRPFILGTPFLITAKAIIKFEKGTTMLRSGRSRVTFHKIPISTHDINIEIKNNIEPIATTMTVSKLILEWEEMIKIHQEKEMEFNQCRTKIFDKERQAPVKRNTRLEDEEVTYEHVTLSLAIRLINKEMRYLGGNSI
nr:hypothetical protein [Tanacetum cinerariifolium]